MYKRQVVDGGLWSLESSSEGRRGSEGVGRSHGHPFLTSKGSGYQTGSGAGRGFTLQAGGLTGVLPPGMGARRGPTARRGGLERVVLETGKGFPASNVLVRRSGRRFGRELPVPTGPSSSYVVVAPWAGLDRVRGRLEGRIGSRVGAPLPRQAIQASGGMQASSKGKNDNSFLPG